MHRLKNLYSSLVFKLIVAVGVILLFSISGWAYFAIRDQKRKVMNEIVASTDRLTSTIRLGTHYAMMLNSRDDINQIIQNISKLEEIETIRIYNKQGRIKYSNRKTELNTRTNIKAEACDICHQADPPLSRIDLNGRTRIVDSPSGHRLLGIISPIYNERSCATDACHVHPADKKVLGALDVVVSLEKTDRTVIKSEKGMILLAVVVFLVTCGFIHLFVLRFVNQPIRRLIKGTRRIAKGDYFSAVEVVQNDEMGQLAQAINQMGMEIGEKQAELNKQRDEYQQLFESVPCIITVQDTSFRLLRYNREFEENFSPKPGDFCFRAYKGRSQKCVVCPVEQTFEDGRSHLSEESAVDEDGTRKHWLVRTTPVKNSHGEIVAAMEMSLDITERKDLEEKLHKSEKKYHAIFNNIPNPVFVLDLDSLEILDCNDSVLPVYEYRREELLGRCFLELFKDEEQEFYARQVRRVSLINQAVHLGKGGKSLFVNIRLSPSEYPGRKVLLVTTSDITKRLEAEQQLIQASKMATLGEMATGVAHELNQPLAVIKTASSFFMKKVRRGETIDDEILFEMSREIDSHVDRASKIINHMREFGRKSELKAQKVDIHHVLKNAFDIFSQQLKVRGIQVKWQVEENLPAIMADPGRLEQVFINLLINARDAIEERWNASREGHPDMRISLKARQTADRVHIEVCDTGTGIDAEIIDRIFEPFYTTKKVGKGTGLGLSISYGIVKDYGGDIHARSQPGKGTCFLLIFPSAGERS